MAKGQVDTKGTEPAPPPAIPEPDQDDDLAQEALAALSPEERSGLGIDAEPAASPAAKPDPDPAQTAEPPADPDPAPAGEPEPNQEPPAASAAEPAQGAAQAAEPGTEPEGEQITVPIDRLNAVLDDRNRLREENAHQKGLIEGLQRSQPNGQAQLAPQPTPQQRLAQIGATQAALDQKFETGEDMTTAEYVKQRSLLDQQRTEVLLEIQRESLPKPTAAPPADDAYLDSQTDQLEEQHPYLPLLSDSDMEFIGQKVLNEAAAAGRPIDTTTSAGVLRWRTEAAKMSDTLGPVLTGKTLQPAGTAQPNASAQTPAPGAGASQDAQARAAKLELQAKMPPDTAQIGHGADKTGLTGADLIARAEKDPATLEDIPAGELEKFLQ